MRLIQTKRSSLSMRPRCENHSERGRNGVAALETAVSLPLLLILIFGSLEIANAVFMKQSLNMAAYEAAKVVTRPGNNNALAQTRCGEVLAIRRVTNYTLSFTPATPETAVRGTEITVTLQAPASNLSYGPLRFMAGRSVTAVVRMVRL